MYYDGRTDARSVRSNMQFMLGEKTCQAVQGARADLPRHPGVLLSLEPPRYPFPIDAAKAARGQRRLPGDVCPMPRHLRPRRQVSQQDRRAGRDRHRPGAGDGPLRPPDGPLQHDLVRRGAPDDTERAGYQAPPLDGIWATAPYLHNGSVPTLHALLESSSRPRRFTRPPSTDFEHYDTAHVGWKFRGLGRGAGLDRPPLAVPGQVHRRHRPLRHGQRRPHFRRRPLRGRADGPDRVLEDIVGWVKPTGFKA